MNSLEVTCDDIPVQILKAKTGDFFVEFTDQTTTGKSDSKKDLETLLRRYECLREFFTGGAATCNDAIKTLNQKLSEFN